MKRKPSDKEDTDEVSMSADEELYPWGLTLHLENEALGALDIAAMPSVGETLQMHARVKVESLRESEERDGKQRSVTLQVTDMALAADEDETSQADRLFGSEA